MKKLIILCTLLCLAATAHAAVTNSLSSYPATNSLDAGALIPVSAPEGSGYVLRNVTPATLAAAVVATANYSADWAAQAAAYGGGVLTTDNVFTNGIQSTNGLTLNFAVHDTVPVVRSSARYGQPVIYSVTDFGDGEVEHRLIGKVIAESLQVIGTTTIDAANANTNTYGGGLVVLGVRVAEGAGTASGAYSHAEGSGTAVGDYSHAEGTGYVTGSYSHVEGDCFVSGAYSHASGQNAAANHDNTFVWSDGTETTSSTNKEFTVHASHGIRLEGPLLTIAATVTSANTITALNVSADSISGEVVAANNLDVAGSVRVATIQVVTAQQGAVDDADALTIVAQFNSLLAKLRTHGLIAPEE